MRLITPARQKGLAIDNGLLPPIHRHEVGTAGF
jgi:hypothetical protein